MLNSAIYQGKVFHHRLQHVDHRFSYPVFMMYLDLDELDEVFSKSLFWSCKHPNLIRMNVEDYFFRKEKGSIKATVCEFIKEETGEIFSGRVCLLTNLRFFGYLINPISCYFCFDEKENLSYVVAEVTNTPWKERKHYLLPMEKKGNVFVNNFDKQLHVSPFIDTDICYHWSCNKPEKIINHELKIGISDVQGNTQIFKAGLNLKRQEIKASNLNMLLIRFPFNTVKIALSIYWQALKLFVKGVPVIKHKNPEEMLDEL